MPPRCALHWGHHSALQEQLHHEQQSTAISNNSPVRRARHLVLCVLVILLHCYTGYTLQKYPSAHSRGSISAYAADALLYSLTCINDLSSPIRRCRWRRQESLCVAPAGNSGSCQQQRRPCPHTFILQFDYLQASRRISI